MVGVPTGENVPVLVGDVGAPRFSYAISKLLGEAAVLHAASNRGVPAVITRTLSKWREQPAKRR